MTHAQATAEGMLNAGLEAIDVSVSDLTVRALLDYLKLLETWNRAYSLTAIRDPVDVVRRHFLDSLLVLPHIRGPRLLDVGTGAGFPGMVIALSCPQLKCVLLDKNAKKTRFCLQAIAELGIDNVEVVRARAEEYHPESPFSTVIARAFGQLSQLYTVTRHLLLAGGRLIAMKGAHPERELDFRPASCEQPEIIPLEIPGLAIPRHLVILDTKISPPADSV